jgi:hypothetical protein
MSSVLFAIVTKYGALGGVLIVGAGMTGVALLGLVLYLLSPLLSRHRSLS